MEAAAMAQRPVTANDKQVGGNHYKKNVVQPWDFITDNAIPFLEGNAIKYLARWRDKGGLEDLHKAKHYLEKIIENEEKRLELELVKELSADPTRILTHSGNIMDAAAIDKKIEFRRYGPPTAKPPKWYARLWDWFHHPYV